jgi:hypothetical protein
MQNNIIDLPVQFPMLYYNFTDGWYFLVVYENIVSNTTVQQWQRICMAFGNEECSITHTINNSLNQGSERYSLKLTLFTNYRTCHGLHLPI